jgi:hypothetical protein
MKLLFPNPMGANQQPPEERHWTIRQNRKKRKRNEKVESGLQAAALLLAGIR